MYQKRLKTSKRNITLDDAFEKFINSCLVNKLSEYTIKNKKVAYQDFQKCLGENADIIYTNQLTDDTVDDYKLFLINKGNISSTINEKISTIMSFFNYCFERGWCEKLYVTYLQKEETFYEIYTDAELEKLLEKPDMTTSSYPHYRSWVMVNFLYSTGVRQRTLINIKIEDLDFKDNIIKLKVVKNKKQMYIPMSKHLKEVLQEYLFHREGKPEDYLFTDKYGNQLNSDVIRGALIRYNGRKKVETQGTHRFRHSFATHYIRNGGSVVDLQHLLGHASLEETQKYVNLLITDLKEHNNNFNPLDNFVNKYRNNKKITIKMKKGGK